MVSFVVLNRHGDLSSYHGIGLEAIDGTLPAQCGRNLCGDLFKYPYGPIQGGENGVELENQLGGMREHPIRIDTARVI